MIAVTLWTFFAALGYAATTIPLKVFFAKLEYLVTQPALALFALTALSYAGLDDWLEKSWVKAIFISVPTLNILLAWTNDMPRLVVDAFHMESAERQCSHLPSWSRLPLDKPVGLHLYRYHSGQPVESGA